MGSVLRYTPSPRTRLPYGIAGGGGLGGGGGGVIV
jgi:hypothetical protein